MRISRLCVEVDPVSRARHFPIPDHSCVVGKKLAFTGEHLLHKHGWAGCVGRKPSSLVDVTIVVEHIREDDSIPGSIGHFQCCLDLAFRCLAPEGRQ